MLMLTNEPLIYDLFIKKNFNMKTEDKILNDILTFTTKFFRLLNALIVSHGMAASKYLNYFPNPSC